jgi:hypothetical protein
MTTRDWYGWLQNREQISFYEYRGRPKRLVCTPQALFQLVQLAEFMAETAEMLLSERSAESGLELIAGDSSTIGGLEKFGFISHLLNAANSKAWSQSRDRCRMRL